MAIVTLGYDAAGVAQDYTTIATAIAGATSGDTIEVYYADASRYRSFSLSNIDIDKDLDFVGMIDHQGARFVDIRNDVFFQTTSGVTVTFTNLTIGGARKALDVFAAITLTVSRCRIVAGATGIDVRSASTVTINSCEFVGQWASGGTGVRANDAGCTVTCNNVSAMGSNFYAFRQANGTLDCYNCVAIGVARGGSNFDGTIGGSHNASDDNTHPATNGVDLRLEPSNTLMQVDGSNGLSAYCARPTSSGSPLASAGTDRGLTEDFDGTTIDQSTDAFIGCFGVVSTLGSVSNPPKPTVTALDNGTGDSATITITGSDVSSTNTVFQWQATTGLVASTKVGGGAAVRVGDGTVNVALSPGTYIIILTSELGGCEVVADPISVSVAATTLGVSKYAQVIDCMRLMIANSPTFQTLTGSADANEALDHVYRYGVEKPLIEKDRRPFALVINSDWNWNRIAMDSIASMKADSTLMVEFVADIPTAYLPTDTDPKTHEQSQYLEDTFTGIIDDIREQNALSGNLMLELIEKEDGPNLSSRSATIKDGSARDAYGWMSWAITVG